MTQKKTPKKEKRQGRKQIIVMNNKKGPNGFWTNFFSIFLILAAIMLGYSYLTDGSEEIEEIPVSTLAENIQNGEVTSVVARGEELTVTYANGTEKTALKESGAALSETLVNYGVTQEALRSVEISVESDRGFLFWLLNLLPIFIPVLFIIFFIWFLTRQVKGAGMQAFSFGQSKARMISPDDKKNRVTFKDVAGAKEAKNELEEVVDFLKNPKKFISIGAKIPKGILLMGAPGTGKTLLARAVAGEAGVAFFSISGSEFVEMFVGVGASRVRDLFKMAKTASPAIIFVDEIDAVGRVRGTGVGGGNDEREQTLNQILVEMDGFEPNEKVIVMAATNRPDVLDPALLRPGRFDRRVMIDPPDRDDREQILKIHAAKKPLGADVKLRVIAERTPGFSGADLANLVNEAAIVAARDDRKEISQYDLIQSIEKVMLGPERKSHVLNKKEKEITAYHEAGHAITATILPYSDPVHKVSVISRGRAAGYMLKLPFEDKKMQSKKEFLDDIVVSLAGYVTEKMLFDDVTTGPSNDLQVSTALARDMVTKYGMSDEIGTVALESSGGKVLFGGGVEGKDYSPEVAARIDSEVSKIMKAAYERAKTILTENRKALDSVAEYLMEHETIERDEFEKLMIANSITPKKKQDIEHQE